MTEHLFELIVLFGFIAPLINPFSDKLSLLAPLDK